MDRTRSKYYTLIGISVLGLAAIVAYRLLLSNSRIVSEASLSLGLTAPAVQINDGFKREFKPTVDMSFKDKLHEDNSKFKFEYLERTKTKS